jgi:hypothetical protein
MHQVHIDYVLFSGRRTTPKTTTQVNPRGKKRDFRTSHTPLYSLRTPLVLPRHSLGTPSYFLVLPRTSLYSLVLPRTPLYSPRTSLVLPRTSSCYFLVLPGTPSYSLVLPSYFGSTEVSLFPPWVNPVGFLVLGEVLPCK